MITTINALKSLLTARKGATILTFVAVTSARLNQTAKRCPECGEYVRSRRKAGPCPSCGRPVTFTVTTCPYPGAVKRSHVNGMINWTYANSVTNQRLREAAVGVEVEVFQPQPRVWGERVQGTPFVEHQGAEYLEVKVERSLAHEYLTAEGGTEIDPSALAPFLPTRKSEGHQGVDKPVILRDYRLDTIRAVTMGGTTHDVKLATSEAGAA